MRQFTKEEYQILLEGLEQLLSDYKEAKNLKYIELVQKNLELGFCLYLHKNKYYNEDVKMLIKKFIFYNKKRNNEYLYITPQFLNFVDKNYTKGIFYRINWLQQKISEIKIILNESNTQN